VPAEQCRIQRGCVTSYDGWRSAVGLPRLCKAMHSIVAGRGVPLEPGRSGSRLDPCGSDAHMVSRCAGAV
jgi:hypothetical protein